MLPSQQDRVVVVLVRARNPSNIGAAARALHDLGFSRLRIVNEFPVPFAAAKSAVDASSVLETAQEFSTVAAAIADCALVFGTTAVGERVLEHPLHLLPEAAEIIRSQLSLNPKTQIALLFGSEKTGLSNHDLSHCHALLTVPMNPGSGERHLSMNLGQAVAVCLYAIATAAGALRLASETWDRTTTNDPLPHSSQPHRDEWVATEPRATAADLERLTTLLRDVLAASGYTRRNPANSRETTLRRLIRRMALSASDAAVWTGILRQIQLALVAPAGVPVETETPPIPSHNESKIASGVQIARKL